MQGTSPPASLQSVQRTMLAMGAFWVLTVGAFYYVTFAEIRLGALESAQAQAAASLDKDLLYRRWAAMHGGLYAPVTERTPPNPYLVDVPERDITTPSGKQLTLLNPAYVTRQVQELEQEQFGISGHITSLHPIRLENDADPWETEALMAFEKGAREAFTEATIRNTHYLRYMRPLIAEESCMDCHARWGGRTGDVRGGMSVTVPMTVYDEEAAERIGWLTLGHCVLLVLGLAGMGMGLRGVRGRMRERERAEEALRTSENRYRTLVESSPDAIFSVDDSNVLTFANQAARHNLHGENLVGRRVADVFPPETAEVFLEHLAKVRQTGEVSRRTEPVSFGGKARSFDTTLAPVTDGKGRVTSVVGMVRDMTASRQLQAELAQAQKMESVGRLAGGVAHDFNNILTVINGFTDFVRISLPEDDERRRDLDEVTRAAGRAKELTRQLLAFARRDVSEPKVFQLDDAVNNLHKMLGRLLGEQIELVVAPASGDSRIKMDPAQLDQILLNLAVNARDAMPDGGKLTVATRRLEDAPPRVAILVTDTGVGIGEDVLPHIFEPFFTTKEAGKGTGLGLATCHGIARQHGGSISVSSEQGAGTTFTVVFPEVQDAVTFALPPQVRDMSEGAGTVLLVEDDDATRRVAAAMLRQTGYRVLEAPSGAAALNVLHARGDDIRLVLTDVVMPRMTGPELALSVEKDRPGLPVLFMSGYLGDAKGRTELPPGAHFIPKPFTLDELSRKVAHLLGH